ncbi:hypothetical protein B0H19DRAFT_1065907 [Mycena capillaripes]|nr:hypothetical protein B0H19DRAFT_1065907 [Mycena capillaripes]
MPRPGVDGQAEVTVSAKRTLRVCHEILSVHNPIGGTTCKLTQVKSAWGRRWEVGKIGMGPGEEIASQYTKKQLQYALSQEQGRTTEHQYIRPCRQPQITSKTGLIFMGHILQLNLTTIPHLISLPKSDSVQEDRGILESMYRALNQGDKLEGLENKTEGFERSIGEHQVIGDLENGV